MTQSKTDADVPLRITSYHSGCCVKLLGHNHVTWVTVKYLTCRVLAQFALPAYFQKLLHISLPYLLGA